MIYKNKPDLLWSDRPSQIINIAPALFYCGIALLLVTAIHFSPLSLNLKTKVQFFIALGALLKIAWDILVIHMTNYILTPNELIEISGVLNRRIDTLELFRVKDLKHDLPFFLRLFKKGTITLFTSDHTTPIVKLYAVNDTHALRVIVREQVMIERKRHGVREFD